MDDSSFILLYKSIVCPHLEYANSVWCTHIKFLITHFTMIYENTTFLHTSHWNTFDQFKACIDKFWMHQDVMYDFTANLTGI